MKYLALTSLLACNIAVANQETSNSSECLDVLRGKVNLSCNLTELEKKDKLMAHALMSEILNKLLSKLEPPLKENPLKNVDAEKDICFDFKRFFNCKE